MNKNIGFAPLIWLIITALVLGGGYVAYKKYSSDYVYDGVRYINGQPGGGIKSSEEVGRVLSKARDDLKMKDWKTYRNEKYGFEFQYPPSYTAKIENNGKNTIVFASDNLVFGVFVPSEAEGFGDNEYNLRFSGNGLLFRQILSTFKFTK